MNHISTLFITTEGLGTAAAPTISMLRNRLSTSMLDAVSLAPRAPPVALNLRLQRLCHPVSFKVHVFQVGDTTSCGLALSNFFSNKHFIFLLLHPSQTQLDNLQSTSKRRVSINSRRIKSAPNHRFSAVHSHLQPANWHHEGT